MAELSIILVNWNCLAYTEQCVASIKSTLTGIDYEVIVVDNASGDAPCQSLPESFPWVKLILSDQNIGFGRANRLGVKSTSGEYLFFLNPDTVLQPDAVRRMLDTLKTESRVGAVGCRLLNLDGTFQLSSVQSFPTILNQLLALESLQKRYPHWSIWGKRPLYMRSSVGVDEVDVVSGAALMVKRRAYEEAGGFNSAYFLYAEEVDLCHALRRAGWKVAHCGRAEITHFGGQAMKQREDGFVDAAMRDSIYYFFSQTRGEMYARLYKFAMLTSAGFRLIVLTLLSPATAVVEYPIKRRNLARSYRKWLRIGRWSLTGWRRGDVYNFRTSQEKMTSV